MPPVGGNRLGGTALLGRRATFSSDDWTRVGEVAAAEATALGCPAMASWCRNTGALGRPTKSDQDRLDAALCTLVALRWRRRPRSASMVIGDRDSGYIVTPASPIVRERLAAAAKRFGVPLDGAIP